MTTNCPSCDNPVSPKAFDCPNCGHPLRKAKRGFFGFIFKWLLIIFNLAMIAWLIFAIGITGETMDQPMSDAERMGAEIGTGIGFMMILAIWVIGDIILGLLTLLTRPSK